MQGLEGVEYTEERRDSLGRASDINVAIRINTNATCGVGLAATQENKKEGVFGSTAVTNGVLGADPFACMGFFRGKLARLAKTPAPVTYTFPELSRAKS